MVESMTLQQIKDSKAMEWEMSTYSDIILRPIGTTQPQTTGAQKCDFCGLWYSSGVTWHFVNGKSEKLCGKCFAQRNLWPSSK